MKKLLVVDGNSIINRAFYGVRPLTASDGTPTNAIFGMINILEKQLTEHKPDYCAMAFDLKHPTFRHDMYADYKAGRHAMPDELAVQFPIAKEVAEAMGFVLLEKKGYEADDILGTLSSLADEELKVLVLTGDRDSLQLITQYTSVLLATNNDTVTFDVDAFVEKYGVHPSQFVDVKALMGDSSDNIPGIKGVGEKTAIKLIQQFSSLDGLYAGYESVKLAPALKQKIETGRESAYLSRTLAKICLDIPLDVSLDDLTYNGMDRPRAKALFERLEFSSFIKRYGLTDAVTDSVTQTDDQEPYNAETLTEENISILLSSGILSICLSDNGIAELFDGKTVYTYDLNTIDNASFANILSAIADRLVCYDCKSIYKFLRKYGIVLKSCLFDVMLGAYVINSGDGSYTLDRLCLSYLGRAMPEGLSDSISAFRLYAPIKQKLETDNCTSLMYDIEMPLASVLAEMELYGFKIDRDGVREYGEMLTRIAEENEKTVFEYAGEPFNINSTKQLGAILFEKLGLPHGKKTKSGYSTSADVLQKLIPYHPIISAILEYRKVTKLKSTYVDGLLRQADETGRVHTTFKQTGTATGRLSSIEPNLQNIPIKTELGRLMRKFFVPENEDCVLIDADYSQIELRLLAHISDDENMRTAFISGEDIHTLTASKVFGVPIESVTYEMRKQAKAVNFGILYGMGEYTLSNDLKISVKDAKSYIQNYLSNYPSVDAYLKNTIAQAYETGFVTTMYDRRRYIPELSGKNKMLKAFGERVAMNSPIQGSAADIIKIAMINVSKRLEKEGLDARLILQVHDELLIEASADCADRAMTVLCEEMQSAASLSIPLTVDCKMGRTWFDA
ncbi:MAG: DNA polymerase I [Clostridia bacterium]|nr:DNA polymerase I [Clostridia bacterium]